LLNGKSKLSKDKLIEYEGKLSERLNRYASRRDVNVQKELDALNELKDLVALKQERLDTDFEVRKAQEQTRIKQKTDQKLIHLYRETPEEITRVVRILAIA
jgi:hypothetical protein